MFMKSVLSLCVCLQWTAWTPCARVAVCVCVASVCAPQAGEVRAVRRHFLPVKNNVQVMERTKPRQGGVCANRDGVVTTAPWVSNSQNTQTYILYPFIICNSSLESAISSFGHASLTQILVWFSYDWPQNSKSSSALVWQSKAGPFVQEYGSVLNCNVIYIAKGKCAFFNSEKTHLFLLSDWLCAL